MFTHTYVYMCVYIYIYIYIIYRENWFEVSTIRLFTLPAQPNSGGFAAQYITGVHKSNYTCVYIYT